MKPYELIRTAMNLSEQIGDYKKADYFAKEGYKPEFGAREMGRVIQNHVKKPLADLILFGDLKSGGNLVIDYVNEQVVLLTQSSNVEMAEA